MQDETKIQAAATVAGMHCRRCGKPTAEFDLCDACIQRKHIELRGSLKLLFTRGSEEATCDVRCGCGSHPCQLRFNHAGEGIDHYFSSECSQ